MLRHEATHTESARRPTTSPPTRNSLLDSLAPEKQSLKKDSLDTLKLTPSLEAGNSQTAKVAETVNPKKAPLPPGKHCPPLPQKPTNKKSSKKQQTNIADMKTISNPLLKSKPAAPSQEMQKQTVGGSGKLTKNPLSANHERGSLPESIILPTQLKVTSNKSKLGKADVKVDEEEERRRVKVEEEERRRALIFRQAIEYDEVKKRCDELEREIAKLELEFGSNSEFAKNEIKVEPIDVDQDMEIIGAKEEMFTSEMRDKDDEIKMQVADEDTWRGSDQSVPKGWKVSKGPTKKFQSPEGFVFETRFAVILKHTLRSILFFVFRTAFPMFLFEGQVRSST